MPTTYLTKNFTANAIAAGVTASTWFGPIGISHLDDLSFHIRNCASVPVNLRIMASSDAGGVYSAQMPVNKIINEDFVVKANNVHVNSIVGENSFNFITILASATAAVSIAEAIMVITGKKRN